MEQKDVYSAMGLVNPLTTDMVSAIRSWCELYRGIAPWLARNPVSLGLPSSIASEMATTATVEASVEVVGSQRADAINEVIGRFMEKADTNVEYACAMGGIIFKPYVDSRQKIAIDVVQADAFYPVEFDSNGNITACMFVVYKVVESQVFHKVEYHQLRDGEYKIINRVFAGYATGDYGREVGLEAVPEWSSIDPEVTISGLTEPLFSYMSIPIGNKVDPRSPIGVSVYSTSIGIIEQADRQYQRFVWEYEATEAAIDANEDMFASDLAGRPVLPEGKERLYRVNYIDPKQAGDNLFKIYSPVIRDESYIRGLNEHLRKIEDKTGLSRGTFSDPHDDTARTAYELKITKQRTYATVTKIQRAFQRALEHLAAAIDELMTLYNLAPTGSYTMNCVWDDSVIIDADTERMTDREDVRDGLMAPWEYRVKWYGETEETARAFIADMKSEEQTDDEIMNFGKENEVKANG